MNNMYPLCSTTRSVVGLIVSQAVQNISEYDGEPTKWNYGWNLSSLKWL